MRRLHSRLADLPRRCLGSVQVVYGRYRSDVAHAAAQGQACPLGASGLICVGDVQTARMFGQHFAESLNRVMVTA